MDVYASAKHILFINQDIIKKWRKENKLDLEDSYKNMMKKSMKYSWVSVKEWSIKSGDKKFTQKVMNLQSEALAMAVGDFARNVAQVQNNLYSTAYEDNVTTVNNCVSGVEVINQIIAFLKLMDIYLKVPKDRVKSEIEDMILNFEPYMKSIESTEIIDPFGMFGGESGMFTPQHEVQMR